MKYFIVNKVELIDGVMTYTPIGYTTSENEASTINSNFNSSLGSFIEENKNELQSGSILLSDFFDDTPLVNYAEQITTSVQGMELSDLTGLL